MVSKIAIRNIPDEVFRALETLADSRDRSTEAEARVALRAWVEPVLVQERRNNRRKKIAERLNQALIQFNAEKRGGTLTPSHVAEAINEKRAEHVEDWFLGVQEPDFSQLTAMANLFGVKPEWLKHGDLAMYSVEHKRLPENPFEAVDWLLTWDPEEPSDGSLKTLNLIRSEDREGALFLVKESDKGHFRTFGTPIHVSEEIGQGGEAALAALFLTLELLYKRYTTASGHTNKLTITGYQLQPDDVNQLMTGDSNPRSLLARGVQSTWWEDLWDSAMAPKQSYWPGWKALYTRIENVITNRPRLNETRSRIRQGATTMAE